MIPKIIHQTWQNKNIPYQIYNKRWVDSWKKCNPDWEYRFWTDEDLRNLIKDKYNWFLPIFDAYPFNICRVDAARYFILYEYGGLYADLDFECLKSFDPLLSNEAVFGRQFENLSKALPANFLIPNALMMSIPRHELWEIVFDKLPKIWERYISSIYFVRDDSFRFSVHGSFKLSGDIHYLTGSGMLYLSILCHYFISKSKKVNHTVNVYPRNYFYPINVHWFKKNNTDRDKASDLVEQNIFPDSYAVSYWKGAWSFHPEVYKI
jgi:hypothetical protein